MADQIPSNDTDMNADAPSQEQAPSAATATAAAQTERPHAPEIKPPSGAQRFTSAHLGSESRIGRFFNALLRWVLIILVILGLGALAGYILLYRPLDQQLQAAHTRATESAVDLQRAQFDLNKAQTDLKDAQTRAKASDDQLSTELTRVQVLRAMSALKTAQVSMQAKDKAAAAKSLATAEDILKQAQTRLNKTDPAESSTLQALFTLVKNGLDRDLTQASKDLDRLLMELSLLDNRLQ